MRIQTMHTGAQRGFTLIELVIVIVIIGILAAVAIPNFADLTDDAKAGVADGVAGTLASASATNYAACTGKLGSCVSACNCTDALNNLVTDKPANSTAAASGTGCKVTVDGAVSKEVTVKFAANPMCAATP